MTFNERLKYYRELNDMSQTELAEKIGVASSTIRRYERGLREPNQTTIIKLAECLNVAPSDFFKDTTSSDVIQEHISQREVFMNYLDSLGYKLIQSGESFIFERSNGDVITLTETELDELENDLRRQTRFHMISAMHKTSK